MSTRANIKVKDSYNTLWFYRHSDGYPEGAMPTIDKFMQYVADRKIRGNTSQASGWLIMLGANEYDTSLDRLENETDKHTSYHNWKVGSIEPTTQQHGDIEYLYELDLNKLTTTIMYPSEKVIEVKEYKEA
jgi:hypothetical protein